MILSKAIDWLRSCFLLLVPVLAANVLLIHRLPRAYQMDNFWRGIPPAVGVPENVLRGVVMFLPLLMPLRISNTRHRLGMALYLAGLLVYLASWAVLIVFPQSAWSTSAIGFAAPAYTPVLWLVGIGLLGDRLLVPRVNIHPWFYCGLSILFLLFHNIHTLLVYSRGT
jgi:hypothetical protein